MTTNTPRDEPRPTAGDDPIDTAGRSGDTALDDVNSGTTRNHERASANTEYTDAGSTSASPTKGKTSVEFDPTLDQHPRQGLTGGTWIALILGAIVLILLLIFIVQNNVPADFAYLGMKFSLPLGVAMLAAAIAGVLVTALLGSVRLFQLNHRLRKLEKERQSIRKAVG